MLGWLKRLFSKPQGEKRDLGGGYFENSAQKCPHCQEWSTSEKPHSWTPHPTDENLLVMRCYSYGHVSNWYDTGFMGIMAHVED